MPKVSFDFSGTTTVITGGSSGIGLTCAELIARCGGNLFLSASRRPEKTEKALQIVRATNSAARVRAFPCEVGDEASVKAFFNEIGKTGTKVDYVIHSAGVSPNTEFLEQTQSEWDAVLNANSTGSFLIVKYASMLMKENDLINGLRGRILLITSTNGVNSQDPVSAHYDSSKAAANMLVRTAAESLAKMEICVNALAPGWIDTELNATLPSEVREKESAKIWMKRWAMPEEMATCAAHILAMPYFMGQVLMVDGGYR